MIKGKCPLCGKSYEIGTLAELPSFPFCTPRCRLIDLGRWIDGAYAIPGPELQPLPEANANGDEDED